MTIKLFYKILLLGFLYILNLASTYSQESGALTNYTYDIEGRLETLGLALPMVASPVANYQNAVISGNMVFLSGKGPRNEDGDIIKGKLGEGAITVKEAYDAARKVGLMQLAVLKTTIGDLNRVKKIVKVTGMVNATDDFTQHPEVINGFSDLMEEVFGERGKHARAAVGMSSLPRGMVCEIEMIVEIN